VTALKHIGNLHQLLDEALLTRSHLWELEASTLTNTHFRAFIKQMELEGLGDLALYEASIAVREMRRSGLASAPSLAFASLQPRMTMGELRTGLEQLSLTRRRALLFALEQGLDDYDLVMLRPAAAALLPLTSLAREILAMTPRRLHCAYLFWEDRNGKPMPLFGIGQQVFEIFGRVWMELVAAYRDMVPVDYDADVAHIQGHLAGTLHKA
jgi:hypothetical protein